jgi:hypothetical protein
MRFQASAAALASLAKDYMEKQALKPIFLTGEVMVNFLELDDALNKELMTEAGFVAN